MSKRVNGRKKDSPLSIFERTVIEVRYRDGNSLRSIGRQLGRNASTVSREIAGKPSRGIGKYIARVAHAKALDRISKRGNIAKLDKSNSLKQFVVCKLKLGWSPEQISIRLPIEYPDESDMRVSHEAIYRYVYSQIYRFGNGMVKPGCCDLRMYLTRDRGSENKNFKKVQEGLGLKVYFANAYCSYFANAYCSYERGSNENANGLLRRYFPKGTDFGKITDRQIGEAEYLINTRPRKRFSGLTPAEVFYQETGVALFC